MSQFIRRWIAKHSDTITGIIWVSPILGMAILFCLAMNGVITPIR